MIGWIIAGLLIGTAAVIVIEHIINEDDLKKVANTEGLNNAIVTIVDDSSNVVTLKDFNSKKERKIQGPGISDSIKVGMKIEV